MGGPAHLSFEAFVEAAGDHAPGVGLEGDDGPEAVPEGPTHQVATTTALEERDTLASHVVCLVELPRAVQSLKTSEACTHLRDKEKGFITHIVTWSHCILSDL